MLVLVTYDVKTENAAGRKRLGKVAKICVNFGQRVQNSVFECQVDAAQCEMMKHRLLQVMDPSVDSIRIYYLGNHYKSKVEHFGAKASFDVTDALIV